MLLFLGMKRVFLAWAALTAATAGCGRPVPRPVQGYIEADLRYPAAPLGGRLLQRPVTRGQTVTEGHLLAVLDATEEGLQVAQLAGRLEQAAARLADGQKGQRPEELAAQEAQVAQLAAAA